MIKHSFLGGQYTPEYTGQHTPDLHGHFKPESHGQYDRIFQLIKETTLLIVLIVQKIIQLIYFGIY